MKNVWKLAVILLALVMIIPFGAFGASAASTVNYYVKTGGTGDGSTPEKALGDLKTAFEKAAADADATVNVIGEVEFDVTSGGYKMPEHKGKLTITGKDGAGVIKMVTLKQYWMMGGDTTIENITFDMAGDIYIQTNLYNFTMGNGVVNSTGRFGVAGIRGVDAAAPFWNSEKNVYVADPTLTLLSGTYSDVAAFGHNNNAGAVLGDLSGTVTVIFGGTASADNIVICRNSMHSAANAVICLDGGTVARFVAACDRPAATLELVRAGMYEASGVNGKFTVIITDNFDITSDTVFPAGTSTAVFYGVSGISAAPDAVSCLDIAALGNHYCEIEAGVYDKAINSGKISNASFDSVVKVASGSSPAATTAPAAVTTAPAAVTTAPAPSPVTGNTAVPAVLIIAFVSAFAAVLVLYGKSRKCRQ